MFRVAVFILYFLFLTSISNSQEPKSSVAIGLSTGCEGIVDYYTSRSSEGLNSKGIFNIGIVELIPIDNVEVFFSQYYSRISINNPYQNGGFLHLSSTEEYKGSFLILPFGLDIRLSKNKYNFIYLDAAYRIDFVLYQILIDGSREERVRNFSLARQTAETGLGLSLKISDEFQIKTKAVYVFKPFYSKNILLNDIQDSRIRIAISVVKYF